MKEGKYWYKYTTFYCPVCGHEDRYKERVYNEFKPKEYYKRHILTECYDNCIEYESIAW